MENLRDIVIVIDGLLLLLLLIGFAVVMLIMYRKIKSLTETIKAKLRPLVKVINLIQAIASLFRRGKVVEGESEVSRRKAVTTLAVLIGAMIGLALGLNRRRKQHPG